MAASQLRGLESHEELRGKSLIRDTRSLPKQIWDGLKTQNTYITVLIILMALTIVKPVYTYPVLFMGILLTLIRYHSFKNDRLPFRLPSSANRIDYSDPVPGRKKFFESSGIFHFGNESKTGQELWLGGKDILTHTLIFGTTGSGKTETLVSLAFNALAMGSGMFYIDPKAAPKLEAQIYVMCRFTGRDDDFRVMNYSTAGKESKAEHPKTLSNTNNPFAFGSAEGLTQLLVSLIPSAEGDNAIFGQNAQTLITSAMYALVELRDTGEIELSIESIRKYLTLQEFEGLAKRDDLSEATQGALKSFLTSVGWQQGKPLDKQPRSLPEQFGYARSYFSLSLASLTDTYGHIYKTTLGEVDMYDIIKNRRVLVTMLPSLEKAPQELQNLGKISLSAVRNAISIGLGDKNEGTMSDVLESLPTDSPTPFLSITDEYAAIPTPGYAEVLTQGRGLGVSAIVASQDFAGIQGADEIGAQQIVANTKIKVCMALEDPQQTWDLFNSLAGEAKVMQTDGFHINQDRAIPLSYEDTRSAKVEGFSRIHMRDLQEQIEGEFHAFFKGDIIRGRVFYANPPLKSNDQVRINQMIPVPRPSKSDVEAELENNKKNAALLARIITGKKKTSINLERPDKETERLKQVFDDPRALTTEDIAIASFFNWRNSVDESIGVLKQETEKIETIKKNPVKRKLMNFKPPVKGALSVIDGSSDMDKMSKTFGLDFEKKIQPIFNGEDDSIEELGNDIIDVEVSTGTSIETAENRAFNTQKQIVQAMGIEDYPEEKIPNSKDKDLSVAFDNIVGGMINKINKINKIDKIKKVSELI